MFLEFDINKMTERSLTVSEGDECISEADSEFHTKGELLQQISELQEAVGEMKSAFTTALTQLGAIPGEEQALRDQVEANRAESQQQIAGLIKLILQLKTDWGSVRNQLSLLQQSVHNLTYDRDLLLEELHKHGVVSPQLRSRLNTVPPLGEGASDGTHSSDSGVALLLERAQQAFQMPNGDQEDPTAQPPINPLVRDYVAGLAAENAESPATPYDSDSSLTRAATKSLTLSVSLSKHCGMELEHSDSDTDNSGQAELQGRGESSENGRQGDTANGTNGREERWRVARELVETERGYCSTLWTLQNTFSTPLRQNGILSEKDINMLFPDAVYQLYEKHCTLLHQLEEKVGAGAGSLLVGDLLDRFTNPQQSDTLRLYTSYINEFPEVLTTFHKLCRISPAFTKFLKVSNARLIRGTFLSCSTEACVDLPACGGLDLGAFLLTPVQRMPRYVLLLKQLLRTTPSSHLDYQPIRDTLNRLRSFLTRLNDSMEHSFQLVTAQIRPSESPERSGKGWRNGKTLARSFNSDSSENTPCYREQRGKIFKKHTFSNSQEAKRSKSVPRIPAAQEPSPIHSHSGSLSGSCRSKLRSRSRSESIQSLTRVDNIESENCCDGRGHCCEDRGHCCGRYKSSPDHELHKDSPHLPSSHSLPNMKRRLKKLELSTASDKNSFNCSKSFHDINDVMECFEDTSPSDLGCSNSSLEQNCDVATTHRTVASPKQVEWIDKPEKKRSSLKSSLKSMFAFKRKYSCRSLSRVVLINSSQVSGRETSDA